MDPRQRRTQEVLHAAVLELAAVRPLSAITVADVARAAGISRDTFYRHADSAAEALAAALAAQFDANSPLLDPDAGPMREQFRDAEVAIFAHIEQHRQIYRNASEPTLAEPIRRMLTSRLQDALVRYLEDQPHVAPATGEPSGDAHEYFAAYGAAGTVGVIERWLTSDHPVSAEEAAARVLAAAANWWWGGGDSAQLLERRE